jgi:hopene-associated glycosyltransferase HpnB
VVSLAAWIYLLVGRGGFWRIKESPRLESDRPPKRVAVVIPARNEESVVGAAIASLLCQDYAGEVRLFLVDDHSSDRTAAVAESVAALAGARDRVKVTKADPLPPGWTGKLWAISEGLKCAEPLKPDYFLLTDADIVHAPDNLRNLVARAEAGGLDLVSLLVKLHCRSLAERALIPAFVYFFFQLYPPRWIASRNHRTAGAAGGCLLIRQAALGKIGGIDSIRNELIDDCALARRVKALGTIWLGVTDSTYSIRDYGTPGEIYQMISRTAFTQLRHSFWWLLATILGIAIVYLAPPLLALSGDRLPAALGAAAWLLMAVSYVPVLRFYRQPLAGAILLPVVALFYTTATVDSAVRYWMGRGGRWKGRLQNIH